MIKPPKTVTVDLERAADAYLDADAATQAILDAAMRTYVKDCSDLLVCPGCLMQEAWVFGRVVSGCAADSDVVEEHCARCRYLAGMLAVVVPLRAARGAASILGQIAPQLRDDSPRRNMLRIVLDLLGVLPGTPKADVLERVQTHREISPSDASDWTTYWREGRLHVLDEAGREIGNDGAGWTLEAILKANRRFLKKR